MEHRGEKRGKQAGSGIRRRATFHEGLEHFVKYYVFTKKKKKNAVRKQENQLLYHKESRGFLEKYPFGKTKEKAYKNDTSGLMTTRLLWSL